MKAFLNFLMMAFDIIVAVAWVTSGGGMSPWIPMMITGFAGMHLVMGASYALGLVE